jgi:DNA-binding CsgD family transcriptional regulator
VRRTPLTDREFRTVALYLDGRTPAEIAARHGVSAWAIYKRLSRARAKLPRVVRRPAPPVRRVSLR